MKMREKGKKTGEKALKKPRAKRASRRQESRSDVRELATSIGLRRSQATARTIQAQGGLTPDCSTCAVN